MKLAATSASLHREIDRGELTQLEFLDLCARELPCDGVVLDVRHFPRTDEQYLAQIKKMAADTGLTIAAVQDDGFVVRDASAMQSMLGIAATIGAPLLATQLSLQTQHSWSDEAQQLGDATKYAKGFNVTLAIRNVADTFCATAADVKRTLKETDSAWARAAFDFATLDDAESLSKAGEKFVLLWSGPEPAWPAELDAFRGFAALSGEGSVAEIKASLTGLRAAMRARER